MNTFHLVVFGGLVGVFAVTSLADTLLSRRAAQLDPHTRELIYQREVSLGWLWQVLELVAMAFIVAGVLRTWGIVNVTKYPFTAVAIGIGLFCATKVSRTWMTCRAYGAEAPGTPASQGAFAAALMVSVAELALGSGVCWYVYANRIPPGGANAPPPAAVNQGQPGQTPAAGPVQKLWVSESEALQLLPGKDAGYLRALAQRQDVRSKTDGGQTLYRGDDIVQLKIAGLPNPEEFIEVSKEPPKLKPKAPPERQGRSGARVMGTAELQAA